MQDVAISTHPLSSTAYRSLKWSRSPYASVVRPYVIPPNLETGSILPVSIWPVGPIKSFLT